MEAEVGIVTFLERLRRTRQTPELTELIDYFCSLKSPHTARSYRSIIREFLEFVEARRLDIFALTENDALTYASYAEARPGQKRRHAPTGDERCTRATVQRKAVVLRGFLDLLPVYKQVNPFTVVVQRLKHAKTGEKRETETASNEEVLRLLNSFPATKRGLSNKGLCALLFGGALRISEVVGMRVSDVREEGDLVYLILRETKAGCAQEQVLPAWAGEIIAEVARARKSEGAQTSDYLIANYGGKRPGGGYDIRSARRRFKRLCEDVRIGPHVTPHSARATAITQLLASGADYKEARDFARHSSFQMVATYDKRLTRRSQHPGRKLKY